MRIFCHVQTPPPPLYTLVLTPPPPLDAYVINERPLVLKSFVKNFILKTLFKINKHRC